MIKVVKWDGRKESFQREKVEWTLLRVGAPTEVVALRRGLFSARKLIKIRRKMCLKSARAPMGCGIVLQNVGVKSKQPNSAIRKCVRIQLIKNGRLATAFLPGDGAFNYVDEYDEVVIESIDGPLARSMGDISGVRHKVSNINCVH